MIDTKMVLGMFLLFLAKSNVWFAEKKLIWRSYLVVKALPTIKRVKLIDKHKLAQVTLDKTVKSFIMHKTDLEAQTIMICLFWAT